MLYDGAPCDCLGNNIYHWCVTSIVIAFIPGFVRMSVTNVLDSGVIIVSFSTFYVPLRPSLVFGFSERELLVVADTNHMFVMIA